MVVALVVMVLCILVTSVILVAQRSVWSRRNSAGGVSGSMPDPSWTIAASSDPVTGVGHTQHHAPHHHSSDHGSTGATHAGFDGGSHGGGFDGGAGHH